MQNISASREVPIDVIVPHSSRERASARLLRMLPGHDESPHDQVTESIIEVVEGFCGKRQANRLSCYSGHVTRGEA